MHATKRNESAEAGLAQRTIRYGKWGIRIGGVLCILPIISYVLFGNLGFNALRGPGGFTWDAALHKQFKVTEKHSITLRLEAFNLLNHVVFSNPTATVTSPQFGLITSGSSGRAFQLAAKYMF